MKRRKLAALAASVLFVTPLLFLLLGSLRAPGVSPPTGLAPIVQ